jgi:hypothetical protein
VSPNCAGDNFTDTGDIGPFRLDGRSMGTLSFSEAVATNGRATRILPDAIGTGQTVD